MRNKDTILLENLYTNYVLTEVNWETDFPDASKVCISPDDVARAFNEELKRLKIPSSKRPKPKINFPRISKGNIPLDDESKINIEQFIKSVTKLPKTIFDEGEKSKHTTDEGILTVNTGIPALRAVLWDEDKKEFYVINTCPGAGKCVTTCYAMQGFYIMNDGKNIKLINRLQLMMNHPDIYANMAYKELELFAFKANREDKALMIRWNDAGDFFSEKYFMIALDVTKRLLQKYNVQSYAYTKIAKFYKMGLEAGMIMNFSEGATKKEKSEVGDFKQVKLSITVPEEVFKKDIFVREGPHFKKDPKTGKTLFISEQHRDILKRKLVQYYETHQDPEYGWIKGELTMDNLLYTDELPKKIGEKFQYNCIVLPNGDSDRSAQRMDVKNTLLLEH